jgi:membrane-associated progesterone receptor component
VALAKMSLDTEHLDDLAGCQGLNFGERAELDSWIEKFRDYRGYPVLGRLVLDLPDPNRILTDSDLSQYNGSATVSGTDDSTSSIPTGYATASIYIGARDKVFDVSFGGVSFYGPGGPYHKFAGRNASRALALMSLDEKDLENTSLTDCTEKQLGVLNDWIKTFEERKGYPIVGRLSPS